MGIRELGGIIRVEGLGYWFQEAFVMLPGFPDMPAPRAILCALLEMPRN
jgi:hypothetical protein